MLPTKMYILELSRVFPWYVLTVLGNVQTIYLCICIYDFHMNLFQIARNIFYGITENELIKTTVCARLLSKGRDNTLTVLVVDG